MPGRSRGTVYEALTTEFATIDLETTGFSPTDSRIVEVGVVRMRGDGTVVEEWSTLVDPRCAMRATEVHRIRAADVVGAPTFAEIAPELLRLLGNAVVVAHNAAFEERFLSAELGAVFGPGGGADGGVGRYPAVCTMRLAESLQLPLKNRKLGSCCAYFEVPLAETEAHTALADARATAVLLRRMLAHARIDALTFDAPLRPHTQPRTAVALKPRTAVPAMRQPVREVEDSPRTARLWPDKPAARQAAAAPPPSARVTQPTLLDVPPSSELPRTTARFAGRCPACRGRVAVGEVLVLDEAVGGWRHEHCD